MENEDERIEALGRERERLTEMLRENKSKQYYVLYILMRQDLPSMNPGKAMAQASHASNAFIQKADKVLRASPLRDVVDKWKDQTEQGFGTVLVLGCIKDDIIILRERLRGKGNVLFDEVIDPTYPYIVSGEIVDFIKPEVHTETPHELDNDDFVCFRNEVTCAYLFADKNDSETANYVGNLKLHP